MPASPPTQHSPPRAPPSVAISLSLTPNTHSYASPIPPILSLTATSHAAAPLTLLTWHTALHPHLALCQGAFTLKHQIAKTIIPQATVRLSRGPLQRLAGSSDAVYFLTLYPGAPVTVSTAFGPMNQPPLPKGHPGRMRPAAGGMVPRSVCGVDGLEAGRKYEVAVVDGLKIAWWRWGTREEVLEAEGSRDWELGWSEEAFTLGVEKGKVEIEVLGE